MMCVDRKLIRERMFTSQISKMVKQKQCCQMQLKHRYLNILQLEVLLAIKL